MNADEIFQAIYQYGRASCIKSVCSKHTIPKNTTENKDKALEELRHLVAIRDDTDTAYPEKPLRND